MSMCIPWFLQGMGLMKWCWLARRRPAPLLGGVGRNCAVARALSSFPKQCVFLLQQRSPQWIGPRPPSQKNRGPPPGPPRPARPPPPPPSVPIVDTCAADSRGALVLTGWSHYCAAVEALPPYACGTLAPHPA